MIVGPGSAGKTAVLVEREVGDIGIPVVRVIVPGLEGLMEDEYVPGARARSMAAS